MNCEMNLMLQMSEDGKVKTNDLVIHCESEEERDKVLHIINEGAKAIRKMEKLESILKGDEEYDCYTKHFLIRELEL